MWSEELPGSADLRRVRRIPFFLVHDVSSGRARGVLDGTWRGTEERIDPPWVVRVSSRNSLSMTSSVASVRMIAHAVMVEVGVWRSERSGIVC